MSTQWLLSHLATLILSNNIALIMIPLQSITTTPHYYLNGFLWSDSRNLYFWWWTDGMSNWEIYDMTWLRNYWYCQKNILASESISGSWNFYGIASVDMSPYQIWKPGNVWHVWRQTCQMDGVFLMGIIPEWITFIVNFIVGFPLLFSFVFPFNFSHR